MVLHRPTSNTAKKYLEGFILILFFPLKEPLSINNKKSPEQTDEHNFGAKKIQSQPIKKLKGLIM